MNKTFNINLGSYPFAIDEEAFNYIQIYLDTIRRHFSASDGCDEILYDIEVRMAELFQEHLKGRAIISMKEVDEVIMIMGKPEDFGAESMSESTSYSSNRKKRNSNKINVGKRLFRDPDDQKIGGVCSGIAAYFGIEDPLWVRLIFALFFFFGFGTMVYFVLWALVPEASNAGDKLSMRGEPSTIENIAKVVENELSDLGDKINEWGNDINDKKKSGKVNHAFYAKSILVGGVNVIGSIAGNIIPTIKMIFKPLFSFLGIAILSLLGLTWAASFIGLTFAAPIIHSVGPISKVTSYLGIGSLFITIGIPILGIMLLIARVAFNYKINKQVKMGFWTIWFLSLITSSFAAMTTVKENSFEASTKTILDYPLVGNEISIMSPVESIDNHFHYNLWNRIFTKNKDAISISNVKFSIEKSRDSQLHIEKIITARGFSTENATLNAQNTTNNLIVNGQEISISKYINIPNTDKFRNQSLHYIIYVPEGKTLKFDKSTCDLLTNSDMLSQDKIDANLENITWTMNPSGLYSKEFDQSIHFNKELQTTAFSKIIIEKAFDIIIKKSDQTKVSFDGPKQSIEEIISKNLDGTLFIDAKIDENTPSGITITIETPNLEMIQLDAVLNVKIDGFVQDKLKINSISNDAHDTNIEFFGKIKNFDISLHGAQDMILIGTGESMLVNLTDNATLHSDKFIVKTAKLDGDVPNGTSFHVTGTFTCNNSDDIQFMTLIGNPKIETTEK